jgi:hypothetical protein
MKRFLIILGAVVVVLLLAGGAYTAVQLLAESETETAVSGGSGARVMQSVQVDGSGASVSVQTTILPAEELPDEETVASGIVLERQDDTLTVGTGAIDLSVDVEVDPSTGQETTSFVPSTNGPELEVILTRDTLLYRDVTDIAGQMPDESGEVTIMQEIRPLADASELKETMEIQVWGERRGDRVVADVVVFGPLAGGAFE